MIVSRSKGIMMRKYAVLRILRKKSTNFNLEIERSILLMLTTAKLFRKQDEAEIKQERNKYMSIVQDKWGLILKKIVLGTVEILTPISTLVLCLVVEFTAAPHRQNSMSRKTFTCQFTTFCSYWLLFASLSVVK